MVTKTHIIKAVFTPTLLNQSENWTIASKERHMLTTTYMRCLRKAAGKTRMDKIRNEEIRRRVNMQPAEQTANKNEIRWRSHIKIRHQRLPSYGIAPGRIEPYHTILNNFTQALYQTKERTDKSTWINANLNGSWSKDMPITNELMPI